MCIFEISMFFFFFVCFFYYLQKHFYALFFISLFFSLFSFFPLYANFRIMDCKQCSFIKNKYFILKLKSFVSFQSIHLFIFYVTFLLNIHFHSQQPLKFYIEPFIIWNSFMRFQVSLSSHSKIVFVYIFHSCTVTISLFYKHQM